MYVGIESHIGRIESKEKEKEHKKDGICGDAKSKKENKKVRKMEDRLLMVVSATIYGKTIKALIDSGATRWFVTPSCITAIGLKGVPRDIFLELGNGEKILSMGSIPEAPMVIVGLTVRVGLTITNLLHKLDLVLGVNCL